MSRIDSHRTIVSLLFALLLATSLMACGPQAELPQCQQDGDCSSGQVCTADKCVKKDPGSNSTSTLTYKIKEQCTDVPMQQQQSWTSVALTAASSKLTISHNLITHCDADLDFKLERSGNDLKIIISNSAPLTRCTCGYSLNMEIDPLPAGTYNVEIWGVKSENIDAQKLHTEEIVVSN